MDCRLIFSIRAKQRPISSISASDSSKFKFYICFRSFRPDYLSVFHGEDTVPPQELRIDCNFPCQEEDDELIKIELRKRNVWAISEKFRTFDRQINFAIFPPPPIFHFRRWFGEFFSLFQSCEISITLSINSLRNY